MIDRLMVSALIEVRSCERFECLAVACEDEEMKVLYQDLWTSEQGHYLTFVKLARAVDARGENIENRWQQMLEAESEIISRQVPGPTIHSGLPRQVAGSPGDGAAS